jgi:hypothetical protein
VALTSAIVWCLAAAAGLATPVEVGTLLERVGDADLALMHDPQAARPVRVLVATRVATAPDKVQAIVLAPAAYKQAMPAFRRIEVIGRRERGGVTDLQIAWELDVPLWNLEGKLWLRPQPDGADLVLEEGGFAPGLFHLRVRADGDGKTERSIFTIEGFANVGEANLAARQLAKRSHLAEPAMTVAAAYVMLKALARMAETGEPRRPAAALVAPTSAEFEGLRTATAMLAAPGERVLVAAIRSRADGRLAGVEVAARASAKAAQRASALRPALLRALPGWQKIEVVSTTPDTCQDPSATCWAVETNLPLFSLDGTWKIRTRPWRARLVAGDREGAIMGIDVVPGKNGQRPVVVWSEHPRLDRAGLVPRRLIAAEAFLEHGLSLALALADSASLLPALERD